MRRRRSERFRGRAAIVTGGASGIGLALAEQLVAAGAHVVLADVADDVAEQAQRIASASGAGGTATGRHLDVRDRDAFAALVNDVAAAHDGLDLLVNNAGIAMGGFTEQLTGADWDLTIDVNLGGVVNGVLAAYPLMAQQGHGHIVNTASGAGLVGLPFVVAYSATKHAVVGLSTALRPEAALRGVRVSVVCPGAVETRILDDNPTIAARSHGLTPRQYLDVAHQKPIPADRFARLALRSIAANRPIIVVPPSARTLWFVNRVSTRLTQRATGLLASRVLRRLQHPA
jgi:NAD(P)-dependent dehydrogenase (short-subunit alcohol dehydrogenase family)